ncbi:DASH family cryptochrome [Pedobacter metabolipauper]|uniref:Cryptochrome DASH n=1 Tax=Pedobacter metabolipauper TaxID=425513 RepID=A0A4R6SXR3_9SPHI|nr:DASH family cryptochrome [Pedobacter metabolipauper]TDQ10239.1 deoxyribodipyrimidine photo-lyase [Pedobacter metabolipauper]
MKFKKILVWFRNDLRLHDNEMLVEAIAKSDYILPVYFFDPSLIQETRFETSKSGINKVQFLLESISALRAAFQKLGGNLLLVNGKPEDEMAKLVEKYDISEVYHHREVGPEETAVSAKVEDLLWKHKINLKHFIGHTLYNKEDLPFPIKDIPDIFAQFKKKTERDAIVKACFEEPAVINFVGGIENVKNAENLERIQNSGIIESKEWGELPTLDALGFEVNTSPDLYTKGGEAAGLEHLEHLLKEGSDIYLKSVKGNSDKAGFSSRLSSWLALGCLSPRKVYWMVKSAEGKFGNNTNFNQIFLGLLWRDYYRFMFKKHGVKFFQEPELEKWVAEPETIYNAAIRKWKSADTGHVLVDRYMKELNESGFIPHAARLLVATYLVHVLRVHWIYGAAYFEEKLLDYSPASNWGNWANVAGAGLDLKSKNVFDLDKQIKILDVDVSAAPTYA